MRDTSFDNKEVLDLDAGWGTAAEQEFDIESEDGTLVATAKHAARERESNAEQSVASAEWDTGFSGDGATRLSVAEKSAKEQRSKKKPGGQRTKRTIVNTIIHVALAALCIFWILPFVGILLESFRCESTGLAGYIWPKQWGIANYVRLFTETKFPRWFGSTLVMGFATAVVQTIFQLAVAYALSRNRFKGRKLLMNVMLIFGMFPGFLTLILLYTWMHDWNLTDANAMWGLIIIYTASSGMGYHIAKGFFDTISHSIDEAAKIDGATQFQIFRKLILPLSKPIIIYTILMGFMAPWGDFVMATFMANNASSGYNVAAGLQWLLTDSMKNDYYTTFCAGGVTVAVPITVLFMCLQKYYVTGVTGGAVKG